MADGTTFPPYTTIPGLKPADVLNFTDQVWISQAGVDRRCSLGDIANLTLPLTVTAWNGRTGAVQMTLLDVTSVGGAPLDSPFFTDVPQAPTPPRGASDNRIATTQFVQDAILHGYAGVSTWNGRAGDVVLTPADITGTGNLTINGTITNNAKVTTGAPLVVNAGASLPSFINPVNVANFIGAPGNSNSVFYGVGGAHYVGSYAAYGTAAAPTPPGGGYFFGGFAGGAYNGSAYQAGPAMYCVASEPWSTTAAGCELVFYTTPKGSTAGAAVAGISSDGSFYVGPGPSPIAQNATGGFVMIPKIVGDPPTGTPVVTNRGGNTLAGNVPLVFTQTTSRLYAWNGSAWVGTTFGAGAAAGPFLPLTGGNVTGPTTFSGGLSSTSAAAPLSLTNTGSGNGPQIQAYEPSLPVAGSTGFYTGVANSTRNQAYFGFNNVGGAGALTNTAFMGVQGGSYFLTIDGNGSALAGNLSVAAPTIPSNGIYLPAANTLGFAQNTIGRWFISSTNGLLHNSTGASPSPLSMNKGLFVGGAVSLTQCLQAGYSADGTTGNGIAIYGNATNGGVSQISTNYQTTDGPLQIGTFTTPNAISIAVNGVVTTQDLAVRAAKTASQALIAPAAGGAPVWRQPSTTDLSNVDSAAGSFTPTISVTGTLGDGVFSGVAGTVYYRRLGFLVIFTFHVTFTLTYTTATGALLISGFPNPAAGFTAVCQFNVTPWPAAPADRLLGQVSNQGIYAMITGNNYVGNNWGPAASALYGLVSGTAYNVYGGGIYATA